MGAVLGQPEPEDETGDHHHPAADAEQASHETGGEAQAGSAGPVGHGGDDTLPAPRPRRSPIPSRVAAVLIALAVLTAGCGDDAPATTAAPTTTAPGSASPDEAIGAWLAAVGGGRSDEASQLLVDDQLAILVAIDNGLGADQLAGMLAGGVPAATREQYWASFEESFEEFAGAPIEELETFAVEEFAIDGRDYAVVTAGLAPGAGSTQFAATQVGGRWRVDLLATLAPALVTQLRGLATSADEPLVREALVGQIPAMRAAVERPAPEADDAVLRELEALVRFLAPALED